MSAFLRVIRDIGLLLARVGLGGILIHHGVTRWTAPGQGVQAQIDYLEQFTTPYPEVATYGAIVLEIVGGICLVVGALTPLVAAAVVAQQGLTIAYTNWFQGFDLLNRDGTYNGGWEYNVALASLALVFVVCGAGRIAVDQAFRRPRPDLEDETVEPTRSRNALAA